MPSATLFPRTPCGNFRNTSPMLSRGIPMDLTPFHKRDDAREAYFCHPHNDDISKHQAQGFEGVSFATWGLSISQRKPYKTKSLTSLAWTETSPVREF